MRPLQITLFILGLVVLSTQSFRHIYVKWVEPTGSVLDEYREQIEEDIALSKDLDEIVALYDAAYEKVQEYERHGTNEQIEESERWHREPYESERKLRSAIERWEAQSKDIFQLWVYWSCGLAAIVFGLLAYRRLNRWLGMVGIITGFTEMAFWTSPLWREWGPQAEFERLLTAKLLLSVVATALLVGLWMWTERRRKRDGPGSADRT